MVDSLRAHTSRPGTGFITLIAFALLASISLAGTAVAQDESMAKDEAEDDFSRRGPYVSGAIIGSRVRVDNNIGEDDFNNWGFRAGLGLRASDHFAVESTLETPNIFHSFDGGTRIFTYTANLKTYAFTGRIQPWGSLGAGATYVPRENSPEDGFSVALRGGLGGDLYLTRHISLTAGIHYVFFRGKFDADYLAISSGAMYRF